MRNFRDQVEERLPGAGGGVPSGGLSFMCMELTTVTSKFWKIVLVTPHYGRVSHAGHPTL